MPLRYLLDEQLRDRLWSAAQRHNARGVNPLDVLRVGDPPDLPLGSSDPDILLWTEWEGRILVSEDRKTLPTHLANHLQASNHSPGIFLVRPSATLSQVVAFLVLAAFASDPVDWHDQVRHIP
jgi:hypothetical protein